MTDQELSTKLIQMDQELRFLWQEANLEQEDTMKERKLKQYWDLYKTYKKQKEFLVALAS